jgi:hypothetical protein
MKTSEILKEAKKKLWNGDRRTLRNHRYKYVCYVIEDNFPKNSKAKAVTKRIARSLGADYLSVATWLGNNGYASWDDMEKPKIMQAYRHRWLDALISEYESKGD